MKHLAGGKGGAAGRSVPLFRCQECHGALAVVEVADRLSASGTFVAYPNISPIYY
jgi:beclin 1